MLEVAANASHGETKRRHVLCQFYDEAARKEWAERASRGDSEFQVNDACSKLDRDILETARMEYDNAYAPKATHDGYEVVQSSGPRQAKRIGRNGNAKPKFAKSNGKGQKRGYEQGKGSGDWYSYNSWKKQKGY